MTEVQDVLGDFLLGLRPGNLQQATGVHLHRVRPGDVQVPAFPYQLLEDPLAGIWDRYQTCAQALAPFLKALPRSA